MIERFGLAMDSLRLPILQRIYQVDRLRPDGILIFFSRPCCLKAASKSICDNSPRILFPSSSLPPSELLSPLW